MTYAKRVDANQSTLVNWLRSQGASVQPLHAVGKGVPDLLVGFGCVNILIEVKMPDGDLTPDQVTWHREWRGTVHLARTIEDCQRILDQHRF
jgi:Holliday junction resolvase